MEKFFLYWNFSERSDDYRVASSRAFLGTDLMRISF